MKFRLVEENELEKRAKYHRKRQKGLSPFYSPDGGNVPLAIDRFNNSVADGANGLSEWFVGEPENYEPINKSSDRTPDVRYPNGSKATLYDLIQAVVYNYGCSVKKAKEDILEGQYSVDELESALDYFATKDLSGKERRAFYLQIQNERKNKNESLKESKWEKRWDWTDSWYNKDFVISKHPDKESYHLEQVYKNGQTKKHFGNYSSLEDAKKAASKYLKEDTVKNSDGTWSNKGEEGSHGKFKTKKKADAQRKAMFANGYKESLTEARLNPLKLSVMKALDFLDEYSFPFPGDDLLADNWHNAKEGIEMGIDPLEETAEFLIGYIGDLFDDIDPDLYNEAKDCYEDILKYSGKGVSITDESLFLEKQGNSAKLDQRSKKYIADPAANAINSLLGLEKRGKGRFGSKNSSNSRQGGNGSWNEETVIKIGGRNFEIMCKKYGFLQKDYNIHNVLREASAKGIKLGDLAWRIKNEGSTNKSVKWIANAIMKFISKNESLTEAWFTPLSEVSSFTGWMDDDNLINEEERFNSKLERVLKTNRNDIQVLIDSDFEYDPRTYDIEDMTQLQEVKTKNIHANKFLVNGIEFVFEDASSSSSPRLYFKSEEDGEAYTNYIDHYYDEEM